MMVVRAVVSHHFLRRRARSACSTYERANPMCDYRVIRAERGPYRWRVVRVGRGPKRTEE